VIVLGICRCPNIRGPGERRSGLGNWRNGESGSTRCGWNKEGPRGIPGIKISCKNSFGFWKNSLVRTFCGRFGL